MHLALRHPVAIHYKGADAMTKRDEFILLQAAALQATYGILGTWAENATDIALACLKLADEHFPVEPVKGVLSSEMHAETCVYWKTRLTKVPRCNCLNQAGVDARTIVKDSK
jgi:hypothetical protein